MLNIIFAAILLPFVPIALVGNFDDGQWQWKSDFEKKDERVLGESKEARQIEGHFEVCNSFPQDAPRTGYLPQRKEGVRDLKLWAGSSVAIDVDSGTILHYENGRKRTQVASLTKVMTAMIVVENIKNIDEEVTVAKEALNVPGTVVGCPTSVFCNGNRMYKGEKVRASDLLKATLLNSANDAAHALGIHIAGSTEKFVGMMNEKARELGLQDTNFCTPSGLEIDGREQECYSSAYDLARIAGASLAYQEIWDTMKMREGIFYSVDGKYSHNLKNTDILLDTIPNCLGGKTGFTPMAGKSLMMATTDSTGKHKVIAVILNDENRWDDMTRLVNWVYGSYEWK